MISRAVLKSFGTKVAFVAATSVAASLWPVACAGRASPLPGSSPVPGQLHRPGGALLPEPAFAYAGTPAQSASIADIAEKVAPTVVNVSSSRTVSGLQEDFPFFNDPFFRRFFGGRGLEPRQRQRERGLGSGVLVSNDGLVLTNNHVVENADDVKVTTADKREFAVKIVGKDEKSDLALLRLQGDTKGLTPLEFGDSSRLRLGDVVLAIGNPFAVGQTVTMGIVSAKGRANVGIAAYEDFIQTDAAINPGNSGGALVDMEGKLIGINTAILSRTGGNMGIGFAIPSNMAAPIMKALLEHGKVVRGWLGVGIQDVNQDLAQAMNLKTTQGVLISEVMPSGPAEKSGLKSGDLVLKLNGEPMKSTGEFRNAIGAAGAGATVKLDILREGKASTIEAKLGEQPEEAGRVSRMNNGGQPGALEGLSLEQLDPSLRQKYDVPASVKSGVVVTEIAPGSPAEDSGLREGDVVLEVNRVAVNDVAGFKQAYAKSKDRVLLRIARGGITLFLAVKR